MIIKRMQFYYNSRYSNDISPNIVVLGSYENKDGHNIICGINLNYLNDPEKADLYEHLPQIIDPNGGMIQTCANLRLLAEDIFEDGYRQYDETKMSNIVEFEEEITEGEENHA